MKWETPKRHGNDRHDWLEVARQLKERPGEWAVVAEDIQRTYVTAVKKGRIRAFQPAGTFEAISRGSGTEVGRAGKLYVRYVG